MSALLPAAAPLRVTVEFGGGLEVLFGGQKRLASLALPADVRTLGALVRWLAGPSGLLLATDRVDLFARPGGAGVRPGVLVLVDNLRCKVITCTAIIVDVRVIHGGLGARAGGGRRGCGKAGSLGLQRGHLAVETYAARRGRKGAEDEGDDA